MRLLSSGTRWLQGCIAASDDYNSSAVHILIHRDCTLTLYEDTKKIPAKAAQILLHLLLLPRLHALMSVAVRPSVRLSGCRLPVGPRGGAEPVERPAARRAQPRRSAALAGLPEHQILWPADGGAAPASVLRRRLRPRRRPPHHQREKRLRARAFHFSGSPR